MAAFAKAGAESDPNKALEMAFALLASNDMHNLGTATFIAYLIISPALLFVYFRGQTYIQMSDLVSVSAYPV
jgi:hypothetical protein